MFSSWSSFLTGALRSQWVIEFVSDICRSSKSAARLVVEHRRITEIPPRRRLVVGIPAVGVVPVVGESIIIDENIQISVIEINKSNIKLGVNAPKELTIYREEIFLKIREANALSSSSGIIDFIDFSSTTLER